jgi:membrane fusion protein, multidrug efflux system
MRTWLTGRSPRQIYFAVAGIAVVVVAAVVIFWRYENSKLAQRPAPPSIPVTVAQAAQADVPIYYDALGTVQALNTVAIRAQVTGQLVSVDFTQGQEVKKGDVLARIDPAPFKAALDQAIAKKGEDDALLIDAEKDLARSKTLVQKSFETQQVVDLQQAKVDTTKATIDADQAAVEAARTQLNFATISAPIDGVVGFRQVDVGNIIHTNDVNPLTMLTQIKPCTVIFTLPQSDLGAVREAMLQGSVSVLAYDQDDRKLLAEGYLLLINNQIDQTTSTIQLKAQFANENGHLWPGEFVHAHILVTTRKDAVTIPAVSLQRGPDGFYVWVIRPNNTAEQRPIEAQPINQDLAIAIKGLNVGETIVVNGQSRLDEGMHVAIRPGTPAPDQQTDQQTGTSG